MKTLLGNRVIIAQTPPKETTNSGIFLPEQSLEPRNIGTIIVVGETADPKLMGKEVAFTLPAAQPYDDGETKGKLLFVVDLIAILN